MKTSALFLFAIVASCAASSDIKYTYTLWIGDEVNQEYCLTLKSTPGIVFYDAMVQAAALDSRFAFQTTSYPPYGRFVDQIGAYASNPSTFARNQYWLIYILDKKPKVQDKPDDSSLSPVGIDSLVVEDHHHYLFWYKTVGGSHQR